MNPHTTCATCLHNSNNHCANESSPYHGAPLKSWNSCIWHTAPLPTPAETLSRLATRSAALDHLAANAAGEYRAYDLFGRKVFAEFLWAAAERVCDISVNIAMLPLQSLERIARCSVEIGRQKCVELFARLRGRLIKRLAFLDFLRAAWRGSRWLRFA